MHAPYSFHRPPANVLIELLLTLPLAPLFVSDAPTEVPTEKNSKEGIWGADADWKKTAPYGYYCCHFSMDMTNISTACNTCMVHNTLDRCNYHCTALCIYNLPPLS